MKYLIFIWLIFFFLMRMSHVNWISFPGGSAVKNLPANAGDNRFDPLVGKISWRKKWQYSCLGNPRTEAPGRLVRGVAEESDMTECADMHTCAKKNI